MRSCLRKPLAPGTSKDRAILVSSVIFFSFSSAMVIIRFTCEGKFSRGVTQKRLGQSRGRRRGWLSSPPLCLGKIFRFRQNCLPFRACNLVQNLVHGFLDSGV